jgi:hypothetical protein
VRREHGRDYSGVLAEHGLDLVELDAVAAYLDLVVAPAEELDGAVGQKLRRVARPVHAPARLLRERVGDEALGRQAGPSQVAARDSGPADVHLAGDADGDGVELGVEQVDGAVRERVAERQRRGVRRGAFGGHAVGGHAAGRLGRPVVVEDGAAGRRLLELRHPVGARGFAAEKQQSLRQYALGRGRGQERSHVRGRRLEVFNLMALEVVAEGDGVCGALGRDEVERAAGGQRRVDD